MVTSPVSAAGKAGEHFLALDSLRGICALAVCLYHFRTTGIISGLPFVRNSWLFVDFFFVLSGFVIASAYGERIAGGAVSVGRFMWLRMGRIYPLHLAVLLAMIALELLLMFADFGSVTQRESFTGPRTLSALASNLALLHSFGVHSYLSWNIPSWSIAAEMWMYLVFAVVCAVAGRRWPPILWLGGALAALWLAIASPRGLNVHYDLGFVRCLFGFATGTFVFWLYRRSDLPGGTLPELAAAAGVIAFVTLLPGGDAGTLLAPFVFGAAILVFAGSRGRVTRVMKFSPFVWLGTISYSTYMIHAFVQARIGDVMTLFGRHIGITQAGFGADPAFSGDILTGAAWKLDLLTLAMLGVVIIGGSVSYLVLERPLREWSRRVAIGRGRTGERLG